MGRAESHDTIHPSGSLELFPLLVLYFNGAVFSCSDSRSIGVGHQFREPRAAVGIALWPEDH